MRRAAALLSLALLLGATGIGPRREERRERRRGDSAPAAAPASAPVSTPSGPVRIAPRSDSGRSGGGGGQRSRPSSVGHYAPGARVGIERHDASRHRHWRGGGADWYGYRGDARWYWTRPYGGNWWWYDEPYGRWAWWNGGRWWYAGPGGAVVYYSEGAPPAPSVETSAAVAPSGDAGPWTSPDGRRLIELVGQDRQAILYDKTGTAPSYMRLLGRDAVKVRFSTTGVAPAILVEFGDGRFAVFDADGKPLETAATAPPKAPEAPPRPPVLPPSND